MDSEIRTGNIIQIFETIEQNSSSHLKYSVILKKALENDDELLEEFNRCLYGILLFDYKTRNMYVERVINFLGVFCNILKPIDDATDHPILRHILNILSECSSSAVESCRYLSCKIINKILDNLEELSDDLYGEIKDTMMERLRDTKSEIRLQAIISLHRLQDVSDPQDSVILHFCTILNNEFNSKVRQLCVENIALTKYTLPHILNRIRDVDVNVRLAAFKKISSKAMYLTIAQKRMVLQCGFLDASEKVRNFVLHVLIENWLEIYNYDYLQLMESIRLDACEDDIKKTTVLVEFMLNALFQTKHVNEMATTLKLNDEKLIDYENLSWETVLYYRIMVQFFRKSEDFDEALNSVIPELVDFCKYIKGYCDFIKDKKQFDELEYFFTLQQFFLITRTYDVADTASRECLNSLVHHMLRNTNLTADVAEVVVENLEKTIPNVKDRSIFICEIISNIMYGDDAVDYNEIQKQEMERHHKISQLKGDIISLREIEECCLSERRFLDADHAKQEIEQKEVELKNLEMIPEKPENIERRTDIPTTIKCLNIAEALLRSPAISELHPALATLNKELIEKALIHECPEVKAIAFKCYCLCCLIDRRSARYGIHIFSAPIFSGHLMMDSNIPILLVCIAAVVDLLRIYGLSLVEKLDDDELSDSQRDDERKVFIGGTSLADLIQGLAHLLEHEDLQVQETATKGVCILLLDGRIVSSSLLSRIIVKWANPATDNERLKQFIGLTLNSLPFLANANSYFGDAVLSTIRTLVYAPTNSPLTEVNIENIVKFMITLCQMSPQGFLITDDIALKICSQMIDKPRHKVNYIFAKTLLLLTISENQGILDDLLQMCDQLQDEIRENHIRRNVIKFNSILTLQKMKVLSKEE